MPYVDQAIAGSGRVAFGNVLVNFALVHLTALGPGITRPDLNDPDHLLRVGWINFFYRGIDIGATERDYHDPPIWIAFEDFRWHPDPARGENGSVFFYAHGVRWSLGPGTEAHLIVG